VVIEHRSRRLIHCNITAHPTAAWTLQQLRETVGLEGRYEYLLHDRDSIFARHLDESIAKLGVKVLKSPPHSPMVNRICERVIGSIRRECLDWLIPLTESHLLSILKSWVRHYNTGRLHMALGPVAYLTRHADCRVRSSQNHDIGCTKTGSCVHRPFSVAYTRVLLGARERSLGFCA
jgi:putative transposase